MRRKRRPPDPAPSKYDVLHTALGRRDIQVAEGLCNYFIYLIFNTGILNNLILSLFLAPPQRRHQDVFGELSRLFHVAEELFLRNRSYGAEVDAKSTESCTKVFQGCRDLSLEQSSCHIVLAELGVQETPPATGFGRLRGRTCCSRLVKLIFFLFLFLMMN